MKIGMSLLLSSVLLCGSALKTYAQADLTPEESQKLTEFLATQPTNGDTVHVYKKVTAPTPTPEPEQPVIPTDPTPTQPETPTNPTPQPEAPGNSNTPETPGDNSGNINGGNDENHEPSHPTDPAPEVPTPTPNPTPEPEKPTVVEEEKHTEVNDKSNTENHTYSEQKIEDKGGTPPTGDGMFINFVTFLTTGITSIGTFVIKSKSKED